MVTLKTTTKTKTKAKTKTKTKTKTKREERKRESEKERKIEREKYRCRIQGCVMRQKTTKIKLRLRTSTKPTDTTHYTSNTFFQTLHTLPTHFQHLCRYTRPFFSVDDAQRKSFASKQIKQITMCWGPKCYIVPIPSLLHTTSLRLHLCLLYQSHPRAFPNLHSFP